MNISGMLTALQRFDSWHNPITGLGSTKDRTAYGSFVDAPDLDDSELEALFEDSGVARNIVSIVPEETFRQGIGVGGVSEAERVAIDKRCEELDLFAKFDEAMTWGYLYGGGLMVFGALDGTHNADGTPRSALDALDVDNISSLVFVDVYDKRDLQRWAFYSDPRHPKYGQTAIWRITVEGGDKYVHESRCILFGGALTARRRKKARNGWDQSILQAGYEELRRFANVDGAVENLVVDKSIGVYTLRGIIKALGGIGLEEMQKRANAMDRLRNVMRSILLDAGDKDTPAETYTRTEVNLTGLPELMDRNVNRLSMVYRIPVPVLSGEAPAGLNATGEASVRLFYDRVRTKAKRQTPRVARALLIVARSLGIAATPTCEWPSLWQLTPAEQDAHLKEEAARDVAYVGAGVLLPEEVTKMRFAGNPAVDLAVREEPALPEGAEGAVADEALGEGETQATVERQADESIEKYAADMTTHGYDACVHGRKNSCPWCKIERTRSIGLNGEQVSGWRAIKS